MILNEQSVNLESLSVLFDLEKKIPLVLRVKSTKKTLFLQFLSNE